MEGRVFRAYLNIGIPFALSVGRPLLAIHGLAALGHPAHRRPKSKGFVGASTSLAARATLSANGLKVTIDSIPIVWTSKPGRDMLQCN